MAGLGQSRERAERLVRLTSVLGMGSPRSLAELRDRFGFYPGELRSAQKAFERDKNDLGDSGVVVELVEAGQPAYWIRSAPRTLKLDAAELDALAVLAATVSDPATGAALAALAGGAGQFPADASPGKVALGAVDVPAVVTTALAEGRQVVVDYRDAQGNVSQRTVEPWDLVHRRGLTYLVCWDVEKADDRNLRIDRMVDQPRLGGPATQPRPDAPTGPVYPTEAFDFVVDAPVEARIDLAEMGGSVTGRDGDRLTGTFDGYRSESVLGWSLRHGAAIREPARWRDEQRSRLQRLVDVHAAIPDRVERPATPKARRQTLSVERLRRLMLLPTYLGEMPGVTRQELAGALGCSLEELEVELELLDSVELPGYGMVGEVSEDRGQLQYFRHLHDPAVALTIADALRLLLLVETVAPLLAEVADGLASLRTKLRSIAPADVVVELSGGQHEDLDLLRTAIADQQVVRFEYRGRKDDAWRDRQVAPEQFRVANGALYLAGTDVVSGEARQFRLDRMGPVEVSGALPAVAAEASTPRYVATQEEVELLVRLNSASRWILTHLEPVAVRTDDATGEVIAAIPTDAVEWACRHVLAAGGQAEVLAPPAVRAWVAGRAEELLARLG